MIFYITTHEKNYINAQKVKRMFEQTEHKFYFVYGKNQTKKVEPYIEVDVVESYENLPLKTYYILEHFLSTAEDYVIKMDDDTYIDFALFDQTTYNEDYIGMFLDYPSTLKSSIFHWYTVDNPEYKIPKKTFDLKYAEGGWYMLSRKAAQICWEKGYSFFDSTPDTYLGEDTKIGMALNCPEITTKDLLYNDGLMYETTKDLMVIHPVHPVLFDKLACSTTKEEKLDWLKRLNCLNLNFKRDIYLNKIVKEVSCNK